jgi:hypothetical protein
MSARIDVLDHGFVSVVETWGSDERIIEAARMSTQRGFEGWGGAPCPACDRDGRIAPSDRLFINFDAMEWASRNCACKGTGKTIGDEKLLAYLWKNKHATPFEMAGSSSRCRRRSSSSASGTVTGRSPITR